jgi:hypothetical protein
MRKVIPFLSVALALFGAGLLLTFFGGAQPAGAAPAEAPADSVPVHCTGSALAGNTEPLICQREDDGTVFTQVAASKSLLLSDIIIVPAIGGSSGQYHQVDILDSVNPEGSAVDETLNSVGGFPETTAINLSAFLVVDSGNYPQMKNSSLSDYSVGVEAYGFLADSIIINPTAVGEIRTGLAPLTPWPQLGLLALLLGLGLFTYSRVRHSSQQ